MTGVKVIPELYLRQPRFTYSICGPVTKDCKKIQNFKEIGDLNNIYEKELWKAFFAHNAANLDYEDLDKKTIPDTISKDKAYDVAINHKGSVYQIGLASMHKLHKLFDKNIG